MSQEEFLTLASLLMDGKLSDAQLARLERHLREYPDSRRHLVSHLFLDALLANELGTESVADLVDMVGAGTPASVPLRPASRRLVARWGWAAGMAAAILLAFGALMHSIYDGRIDPDKPLAGDPGAATAQIVEWHGLELINVQGEPTAAVTGADIVPGQTLRTVVDESFAVLSSNGSARVEMQGDTTARLVAEPTPEGGKRFFLSQGVLRVVASRKSGSKLTVTTPHAAIHADGTFTCSTTSDATYVEVEAGRVRLVRQADGQDVEITDGFSAIAAADIDPLITKASTPSLTTPLHVLKKAGASKLAFSADGLHLTTLDAGGWRNWNAKTGQPVAAHPVPDLANGVFSRDARVLAGSGKGASVRLIDLAGGKQLPTFSAGGKEIRAMAIASDASAIATAELLDRNRWLLRLFDGATGAPRRTVRIQAHVVRSLAFSPDASLLAVGTHKGPIFLVETAGDKEPAAFHELSPGVAQVLFSPDGRQLAAVGIGGSVVAWSMATRSETHRFQATGRSFLTLAYSPGGRFLAAGTRDGTITLWNAATGAEQLTLKVPGGTVRALAFSADGRMLAAAAARPAFLWRLPDDAIDPVK